MEPRGEKLTPRFGNIVVVEVDPSAAPVKAVEGAETFKLYPPVGAQ